MDTVRLLLLLLTLIALLVNAQDDENYDVIVVGAGLAGLSAANEILDQRPETKILILEAKNASGGRVLSAPIAVNDENLVVDLGAQWIGRKHKAIQNLAKKFGLTLEDQPVCGERVVLKAQTPASVARSRRLKRSYQWTSSLSATPSFSDVLRSPDLESLSAISAAQFISEQHLDLTDGDGIKRLLQTFYDAPDTQVSALQILLTVSSDNSTVDDVLASMGHGSALRIKEGLAALVSGLSNRHGLTIRYSSPVTAVSQVSSSLVSVMANGQTFNAEQIIIAVPPAVAATIELSPVMPQAMTDFISDYRPRGYATYFVIVYDQPFWRQSGKSGQIIYAGSGSSNELLWLSTFDTSENNFCATGSSIGILWGIAHFRSGSISSTQRYAAYANVIAQAFEGSPSPIDVVDHQFYNDEYALGSVGTLPVTQDKNFVQFIAALDVVDELPYSEQQRTKTFSLQTPNIHFTAAEFSKISIGMMNGAVEHGQLVAKSVLARLSQGTTAAQRSVVGGYAAPPGALRDEQGPESTTFNYETSTHYPPASSTPEPAVISTTTYDFPYSTSVMYPDVMMPASFATDEPSSSSEPVTTSSAEPSTSPVESTSSSPAEPSTDAATSALPVQRDESKKEDTTTVDYTSEFLGASTETTPETTPQPSETTPFEYETSSHYPSSSPEPTQQPIEHVNYDFPYSTSTHYPESSTNEAETTVSYEGTPSVTEEVTSPSNITEPGETPFVDELSEFTTPSMNDTKSIPPSTNATIDTSDFEAALNVTEPESVTSDEIIDLLSERKTTTEKPQNETMAEEEIPELTNLEEANNSTELPEFETTVALNITEPDVASPDEITDLLNDDITTPAKPQNETSPEEETPELLNHQESNYSTELPETTIALNTTEHEAELPDEIANLLNDEATTTSKPQNETSPEEETPKLLNPEEPNNSTDLTTTSAPLNETFPDSINDLLLNDEEPGNNTESDDISKILNQEETPLNSTESIPDAVLDLLNSEEPANEAISTTSESPQNITESFPDTILDLLNPEEPANVTKPLFDTVLDLLNPENPQNETSKPDAISEPQAPDNSTESIPDAILDLLNPQEPKNITSPETESTQEPIDDTILDLLNPEEPNSTNKSTPAPKTPFFDNVLDLLNPVENDNNTEPEPAQDITNTDFEDTVLDLLNPTEPSTNNTQPEETPEFDAVLDLLNPSEPSTAPSNDTSSESARPPATSGSTDNSTLPVEANLTEQLLNGEEAAPSSNKTLNDTNSDPEDIVSSAVEQVEQNIRNVPKDDRKPIAARLSNALATLLNLVRRR